jgi:hypothetical protein
MRTEYVVTDHEGDISWSDKTEKPETFRTWKAATARAVALAKIIPGKTIGIYELVGETTAVIDEPLIDRKHPREHYK